MSSGCHGLPLTSPDTLPAGQASPGCPQAQSMPAALGALLMDCHGCFALFSLMKNLLYLISRGQDDRSWDRRCILEAILGDCGQGRRCVVAASQLFHSLPSAWCPLTHSTIMGSGMSPEEAISSPAAPPSAHSLPSSWSSAFQGVLSPKCPWSPLMTEHLLKMWDLSKAGQALVCTRLTSRLSHPGFGREVTDGGAPWSQEPDAGVTGGTLRGPGSTYGSAFWDLR